MYERKEEIRTSFFPLPSETFTFILFSSRVSTEVYSVEETMQEQEKIKESSGEEERKRLHPVLIFPDPLNRNQIGAYTPLRDFFLTPFPISHAPSSHLMAFQIKSHGSS